MNKLTIIGNVVRDGELRATQTGVSVCTFTVAVNQRQKKDGEDNTEFFRVTAWRKLADTCGKYVKKGMKICVIGAVGHDEYTDSKGEKRFSLTVVADDVEFLSRVESNSANRDDREQEPIQSENAPSGFTDVSGDFDELPF